MPDDIVTITPSANGPNIVKGQFRVVWPSGHEIVVNKTVALCRCGHSNDKPFCDGTHKKIGFQSVEGDETAHKAT